MKALRAIDGRADWTRGNVKPGRELARPDAHGRPVKLGVIRVILDAGGGRYRAITDKQTVPFRRGGKLYTRSAGVNGGVR